MNQLVSLTFDHCPSWTDYEATAGEGGWIQVWLLDRNPSDDQDEPFALNRSSPVVKTVLDVVLIRCPASPLGAKEIFAYDLDDVVGFVWLRY